MSTTLEMMAHIS